MMKRQHEEVGKGICQVDRGVEGSSGGPSELKGVTAPFHLLRAGEIRLKALVAFLIRGS